MGIEGLFLLARGGGHRMGTMYMPEDCHILGLGPSAQGGLSSVEVVGQARVPVLLKALCYALRPLRGMG